MKSYRTLLLPVLLLGLSAVASAQPFGAPAQQQMPSLKDAYKDYFKVGVAVNFRNVTVPEQQAIVLREFNSVTAENDMKPESTEPQQGQFNWMRADSIADFCRRNGIKMRGHCLMWHSQIGEWMYKDKKGNLVTKEVLFKNMKSHIQAVVSRYKDVVYCWDVVNEAIADNQFPGQPIYRQSPMYQIAGDEFIRKAFEYAREADPNALLFYNDYNECDPGKRERICQMLRTMIADGVPIDGFGMQGHYNVYGPSEDDIDAAITAYAAIVPHIHVTELDVRVNEEMGGSLRFSRGAGNVADYQKTLLADQYNRIFRVFRRHAKDLDCVTFWNLGDRDSWLGAANYPLLFDSEYKPKAAYNRVVSFDPALDNAVVKEDFVPSSFNQPGQQYPMVNSQGYARFRVVAPQAKSVITTIGRGGGTVLRKDADGVWVGTTAAPEDPGFHYYHLIIDGGNFNDPGAQNFYGSTRWESGLEVPAPDDDFYALKNVPHGRVQEVLFWSESTQSVRTAWVYTPPTYDAKAKQRFPVLYLQHGWGENETSWFRQGKAGIIMDNLIAEGKAVPFIVVMTYGMTNEIRFGGLREFTAEDFEKVLVDELVPYIDSHFKTLADKYNRAMAGLSMGGFETRLITLRRPEVFGSYGLLSGGTYSPADLKPEAKPRLIFQSCGSKENPDGINKATADLQAAGFNAVGYVSPGTAHEFLTWRRSLYQLAPLLFRK